MTDDSANNPLPIEDLQNCKIFLATPCYGGMMCQENVISLLGLVMTCAQLGVKLEVRFEANESLITRGRNHMVAAFMASEATHLLFVDADIQYLPQDAMKLLLANRNVAVGSYPLKTDKGGESVYVTNLDNNSKIFQSENTTLVPVVNSGTGFMMIKREAIEALQEKNPDLKYTGDFDKLILDNPESIDEDQMLKMRDNLYSLFDCIHDESDNNAYLSEDYTFCKRWREQLNGKIWLDPSIKLNHIGRKAYQGDVLQLIKTVPALKAQKKNA